MTESINPYESDSGTEPTSADLANSAGEPSGKKQAKGSRLRAAAYSVIGFLVLFTGVAYASPETIAPITNYIPDSMLMMVGAEMEPKQGQSCCSSCSSAAECSAEYMSLPEEYDPTPAPPSDLLEKIDQAVSESSESTNGESINASISE